MLANRLFNIKKMREIKFRFWDKALKKMIYRHLQPYDCEHKEIEVMQLTGLKDKHGKEIYEGDILTYNGITSNGNKIIREVNYNVENARFQSGMYLLSQSIELSEIIGNIYENPELTQTTS